MKIIHCADLHLDSQFRFLDDPEKRRERKSELLKAFEDMVSYGASIGASAIIIAGDLFDSNKISAAARNSVIGAVSDNPSMQFFYLKGNHDKNDFLSELDDVPANLHTFNDSWTFYDLGSNITLAGAEFTGSNSAQIHEGLVLDQTRFNIVTLHGQEAGSEGKDGADLINLSAFRNKGVDYMALGHIHTCKKDAIDARAFYCYPGCLESRGFDECGPHGFVLLDIDIASGKYSVTHVSNPIRECHVVDVDVSACGNTADACDAVESALAAAAIPASGLVEVNLTGTVGMGTEIDESYMAVRFRGRYYHFKLKNSIAFRINYEDYKLEQSLKGEFIRTVQACDDLSEEDKAAVIRMGLCALRGEEIA